MIYFDEPTKRQVVQKVYDSLEPGLSVYRDDGNHRQRQYTFSDRTTVYIQEIRMVEEK